MATPPDDAPRWPDWIETWVIPFIGEPILWPVGLAILGHVMVLFALGALDVIRGDGYLAAVLSVAVTVGLGGWEIRLFRRPGPVVFSLAASWLAAAGLVALALKTGFL